MMMMLLGRVVVVEEDDARWQLQLQSTSRLLQYK